MEVTADAFKDNISPGSLWSVTDGHLSRNVSFLSLRNRQVRCSVCFDIILRPFWKHLSVTRLSCVILSGSVNVTNSNSKCSELF